MIKQARGEQAAGLHNADEALFLDNPRPRDSEGFKIQHGLNTPKQDWRTANKNTYLKHVCFRNAFYGFPAGTPYDSSFYKTHDSSSKQVTTMAPYYGVFGCKDATEFAKLLDSVQKENDSDAGVGLANDGYIHFTQNGYYLLQVLLEVVSDNVSSSARKVIGYIFATQDDGTYKAEDGAEVVVIHDNKDEGEVVRFQYLRKSKKGDKLKIGLKQNIGIVGFVGTIDIVKLG